MSGMPGISPRARPPSTRVIGYGTFTQLATAFRPAAETKSAAMKICRSPTPGILYGRAVRRVRITMVLSAIALVGAGVVVGHVIAQSGGATATRAPLAQSTQLKGAKGRTPALARVPTPAGGPIALHPPRR